MIKLKEVKTKADLKKFLEFPSRLYAGCPYYVPSLYMDEEDTLNPKKNAAYEYCEARPVLAYKDGVLAGRICGILNHAYNEKWGKHRVRFNRWDVIDDIEVTKALIADIEAWGKSKGADEITGPIGFCDMDKQGLLIEGFEEKDLFITTYNYPYYATHLEQLGFKKDADWVEMQIKMPDKLDEKIIKVSEGMMRKLKLHRLEIHNIKRDAFPYVDKIFDLLNEAYADLYGVVPLNKGQVDFYKDQFKIILNPKFVSVVLNEQDEVVGFGVAAPSMAEAAIKSKGHLFPLGWYRILRSIHKNDTLELLLVAVKKEYQNKGVNSILITDIYKNAVEFGIKLAETGPELELNEQVQAQWKRFETRRHKRRRCYVKAIEQ